MKSPSKVVHVHKILDPFKKFFLECLPTYCVFYDEYKLFEILLALHNSGSINLWFHNCKGFEIILHSHLLFLTASSSRAGAVLGMAFFINHSESWSGKFHILLSFRIMVRKISYKVIIHNHSYSGKFHINKLMHMKFSGPWFWMINTKKRFCFLDILCIV